MTDYRNTIGKSKDKQTSGLFDDAVDVVQDTADSASDAVDDTVDTVQDTVDDTTQTVDDTVSQTQDDGGVVGITENFIDDTVSGAQDTVDDAVDDVGGAAEETADFLGGEGTGDDAFSAVTDTFDDATDTVDDAFGAVDDTVSSVDETVDDAFSGVQDTFEDTTNDIGSTFDDVTDDVGSFTDDLAGDTVSFAGDTFDQATDFAGNVGTTLGDFGSGAFDDVTDIGGDITSSITDFGDTAMETTDSIVDGITGFGEDTFDTVTGAAGETIDFGTDVVGGGIDGAIDLGSDAVDAATGQDDQNPEKQWGELSKVEQMGRCVIQKQESNQGDTRYMTATANEQGDEVALRSDGSMVSLSNVQSMSDIPWHSTLDAARAACEAADLSKAWGELEQAETHNGGVILSQSSSDGDTRYFALVPTDDGGSAAVATDGSKVPIGDAPDPASLPSYPNIESARSALDKTSGPSRQWGQLEQVGQTGQCAIMAQASSDGNQRFFTFTEADNGKLVAMTNDGRGVVVSSVDNAQQLPHYPTQADAEAACPSNDQTPQNGGDNGPTDDSTSTDGPTSGNTQRQTTTVTPSEGGAPPEVDGSEVQPQQSDPLPGGPSGLLDMEIAGLPLPLVATAGVGALGVVSKLFGDDSPRRAPRRSRRQSRQGSNRQGQQRTQKRSNVSQRSSKSNNGNNGGK